MQGLRPASSCVFCDGTQISEVFVYDAPPAGETYFDIGSQVYHRSYDRCEGCGHFFGRHELDLSRLYETQYVDSVYGGIEGMSEKLEKIIGLPSEASDNVGRVKRVNGFADSSATYDRFLLDVGAGIGVFPSSMKDLDWCVTAIEPDPRTVEHLRTNVGIVAYADDIFDLDPKDLGMFDAISFNKVLEHVEEPILFLAKGAEFLARNGFIYLELPDVEAATIGRCREEFFIEHHHVFSPASFALLVERAKLSLVSLERLIEPSGKFTLAGFVKHSCSYK